jgi:hypothetical protein
VSYDDNKSDPIHALLEWRTGHGFVGYQHKHLEKPTGKLDGRPPAEDEARRALEREHDILDEVPLACSGEARQVLEKELEMLDEIPPAY